MRYPFQLQLRDDDFVPPRCPREECPAHQLGTPFPWTHRGTFYRKVDGLDVQRFQCLTCRRSFSTQTFRTDYRLRRPETVLPNFVAANSKTTLRKMGRNYELNRSHVARRQILLATHARRFHEHRLQLAQARGGLGSRFQFDELESYEQHRKLKPLTGCVAIEVETGFIVHTDVETLPARKPLKKGEEAALKRIEAVEGVRRSGSRQAVQRTVEALGRFARAGEVKVTTDKKSSYRTALEREFGDRLKHTRIDGRRERGNRNPLFPINHTLARLRDLVSRLVRQTWAAAKKRERLADHIAITTGFRNYVDGWRSEPAERQRVSAAQVLGLATRRYTPQEYLYWMDPLCLAA
jgi:hypothetical protein